MAFLSLPNELILLIAESLARDAHTLNSLTRTNRHFTVLLSPLLNHLAAGHPKFNSDSSGVLIWAVMHGNAGLAKLALEKGCKSAIQSHGPIKYTALHLAAMAEHGGEAIIRLLLDNGADTDAVNLYNRTPLHCAAMCGRDRAAKLLLDSGADPNSLENVIFYGRVTPLYWAAKRGHYNTFKVLLDNDAEIYSGVDSNRQHIVHWAARHKDPAILHLLLENGADFSARNHNGETALHCAAEANQETAVRMLLDNGANPVAQNSAGETPLHLAIIGKHEPTIEAILSHGTDPKTWSTATHRPASSGYRALHLAIKSGKCAIFDHLVRYGADINARTDSTHTVLHLAAIFGDEVMVSHVLSKKFGIDVQDADGNTALHCAVLSGKAAVARLLLKKGADVAIVNIRGKTPLQLGLGDRWKGCDETSNERQTGPAVRGDHRRY